MSLRDLCTERTLEEKWLLAPSRRVGIQWLDTVARSGQPVLNFRVNTLKRLAFEFAAPAMEDRGLELINERRADLLVAGVFGDLAEGGRGYIWNLGSSHGLIQALARTVRDLRLAGLASPDIKQGSFEVASKGAEVKALLSGYEERLRTAGEIDYPGAILLAIERLRGGPSPLGSTLVVMPHDLVDELQGLERLFWQAVPVENRVVVAVDRPGELPDTPVTNAALWSFVACPSEAPIPGSRDKTAEIFRAVGEVNEVREVLRRCVEGGIPFDDVEIIHTDTSTYVPLIYELCRRMKTEDPASIPVTFAEGIPVRYSTPARALLGWLSWIGEGYPQSVLVEMITDGLLLLDESGSSGLSSAGLGAALRAVPIGSGRDRYTKAINRALNALDRRLRGGAARLREEEDVTEEGEDHRESMRRRIVGLEKVRALALALLELSPREGGFSQREYLERARAFLERHTRRSGKYDQYCLKRITDQISDMIECLADGDVTGLDPETWLTELVRGTPIEGEGPRPGCLYVTDFDGGGHSGRGHTFIIGLDDGRFPGAGRQDPLLLDGERSRISGELPTGTGRLAANLDDFAWLLSRLRGVVTLGYCCRSLTDDREMFPSAVVLSAYRILDKRDGDQKDLVRWAGDPASFAPTLPERSVDATEWWLSRTCGDVEPAGLEDTISQAFPNLARGFKARAARESDLFTEYEGYVPEAGAACDPAAPEGPALSASRLETLARCPLEYFFKHVLEVEPPEEYKIDPAVWLDPRQRGGLLHSAFRRFMARLVELGLKPDFDRDTLLLREILDKEIDYWRSLIPPPSAGIFDLEKQDIHSTARIFLQEEQEHCRSHQPLYFEVSIGMEPEDEGGPLDCPEAVGIELPGGSSIRARGRIDRIDLIPSESDTCYVVWDYKTGSAYGFRREDPFRQGRHIQNALYLELAAARLAEVHPGARVVRFGYFFPGLREHGERIVWEETELSGAKPILLRLCLMISSGCFPFTDRPDEDLVFSDYRGAFGDLAGAARDIKRKLQNPRNEVLRPFRELREYEGTPERVTE